jgi:hypothetical protein
MKKPNQIKSEEEIKFIQDTCNSLDEALGETNRTPASIRKRLEDDAANGSGAIDLNQHSNEDRKQYSGVHVAIPPDVQEELDKEPFPLADDKALYFEHLMKRHYSVEDPHDIVMDTELRETGTLVEFNLNASKEFTGFTYYHE